jgi:hypothetical protein
LPEIRQSSDISIIRSYSCISHSNADTHKLHTENNIKTEKHHVYRTHREKERKGNRPLVREIVSLGQGEGHSRWLVLSHCNSSRAFDCAMNGKLLLAVHTRICSMYTLMIKKSLAAPARADLLSYICRKKYTSGKFS